MASFIFKSIAHPGRTYDFSVDVDESFFNKPMRIRNHTAYAEVAAQIYMVVRPGNGFVSMRGKSNCSIWDEYNYNMGLRKALSRALTILPRPDRKGIIDMVLQADIAPRNSCGTLRESSKMRVKAIEEACSLRGMSEFEQDMLDWMMDKKEDA